MDLIQEQLSQIAVPIEGVGDTPLPDAVSMMTENDIRALLQVLLNTTRDHESRILTLEGKSSGTINPIL